MRIHCVKLGAAALVAAVLAACGGGGGDASPTPTLSPVATPTATPTPGPIAPPVTSAVPFNQAKFLPAASKTLITVGQDIDADNNYVKATGNTPAAVTIYTSLNIDGVYARKHGAGEGVQDWNSVKVGYPNSAITAGLYMANGLLDQYMVAGGNPVMDANVDKLIDELQSFNRPVFLRIGYEADANFNGHDPVKYKAAWRKIVERIRAKKATRIATVWQVLGVCGTGATLNNRPTEDWYPGDDIVDWTGLSWFREAPTCTVNDLRTNHPTKPIMIAEWAPAAYAIADGTYNPSVYTAGPLQAKTGTEIWNEKFKTDFEFIAANKDIVRAVSYINQDWKAYKTWQCNGPVTAGVASCGGGVYWGDTRVEANPTIKANWLTAIADPQYLSSAATDLFAKFNGYQAGTTTPVKGPHRALGGGHPVPGVVQAEAYDRGGEGLGYHDTTPLNSGYVGTNNVLWRANEAVDIMTFGPSNVTDGSDKFGVTDAVAGEWLDYTVNAGVTGSFQATVDVASAGQGGTFELLLNGVAVGPAMTVPNTGGTKTFQTVVMGTATLTSLGTQTLRLHIVSTGAGASAGNFDQINIATPRGVFPLGSAAPVLSSAAATAVEIENYDAGGESVAYHDSDTTNSFGAVSFRSGDGVDLLAAGAGATGYIIGYTAVGEWFEYTLNVQTAGAYTVTFSTAYGPANPAGSFEVSQTNGTTVLGTASFNGCPAAGVVCDYNAYANNASGTVTFASAGVQTIRVTLKGNAPGNLDKMTFTKQ
jgi:hypothetical protein